MAVSIYVVNVGMDPTNTKPAIMEGRIDVLVLNISMVVMATSISTGHVAI